VFRKRHTKSIEDIYSRRTKGDRMQRGLKSKSSLDDKEF
jgi:hypothetical protein